MMTITYDGKYSLTFKSGNVTKNTWSDWHLVPSAKPEFVQPTALYKYVDIPGRDGQLDLTDYLIGRPTYSDRKGTFEFIIASQYIDIKALRQELASFFKGQRMEVTSSEESSLKYKGRFFFKGITSDKSNTRVTIEYQVDPYRYNSSDEEDSL